MGASEPGDGRDGSLRCAQWARTNLIDPIGSMARFDSALLVEVPPPWPADVAQIPALARVAARGGTTRVLAVVPPPDAQPDRVRVAHWQRGEGGRLAGRDHLCRPRELPALLDALLAPGGAPAGEPGEPGVAICAHGRRDVCCGRWGTLLHAEVAGGAAARTWRCSHTGGHRFAPTAITFPDGRGWGLLDADLLRGILDRSLEPAGLRGHYRGSAALDPWAQVVEREMFERLGWAWTGHEVTGTATAVAADGRSATVELAWRGPDGDAATAQGEVVVVRDYPVPTCGSPPAEGAKRAAELALRRFTPAR